MTHPYTKVSTRQKERYGNLPFWNNFSSCCKNCNKKSSARTKLVWIHHPKTKQSISQEKVKRGEIQSWRCSTENRLVTHSSRRSIPDTEYSCQTSLATRHQCTELRYFTSSRNIEGWGPPECDRIARAPGSARGVVRGNRSWWPRLMKLRWVLISAAAVINYLLNTNIVIFGKFLIYFIPLASRFRWMSSHHKHSEKNRQRPQFII